MTVRIDQVDEVYNKIVAEPGIVMEMSDFFTFEVPGAKFSPAYKARRWDGKIRLLNNLTCSLYAGLNAYVEEFCRERGYDLEYGYDADKDEFSVKEARDFISTLSLPDWIEEKEYQLEAFVHAVRERRCLLLSPTASGKSLIIYFLMRYYDVRTLIIVPTVALVHQLSSDFADYGLGAADAPHKVYGGQDKDTDRQCTVTTWQSIYELPPSYFKQFELVIGDEAHLFQAKSLVSIMTKLRTCRYRFGTTGTLDGSLTNRLVLEGLFGPVKKVTTTAALIEQGHISPLLIKIIILSYSDEVRAAVSQMDYQGEIDFIVSHERRNTFIKNLALSLPGNTLLLFRFVEKHGKVLYEMLKDEGRNVYYSSGETDPIERERIRKIIETEDNAIIVASSGTFSTGSNMKRLHNIIFASPYKSRIKNLQSIGRSLRLSEFKEVATLYDVADDFSYKGKKNYTLDHLIERVKVYIEESFDYKTYKVSLK